MSLADSIAEFITQRTRVTILVLILLTAVVGAGATAVEQSTGLQQFETNSEEADKLDYINNNFGDPDADAETTVQVIIQGDNVLSKDSLLSSLNLQADLRANESVDETLKQEDAFGDVANIVAITALRSEQAADLEEREATLQSDQEALQARSETLVRVLNDTRELQTEYDQLNGSLAAGEISEQTYQTRQSRIQTDLQAAEQRARDATTDAQFDRFQPLIGEVRNLQREAATVSAEFERSEIDTTTRDQRLDGIETSLNATFTAVPEDVLSPSFDQLETRADQLEADATALEEQPSLQAQREHLAGMSQSEINATVESVLGEDGPPGALALMPTAYDPGATSADARAVFITQTTSEGEIAQGEAPPRLIDAQVVIDDLVETRLGEQAFVFGAGIVSDEIERSLIDSLEIVIPVALLFVTVALLIAYRDLLDIVLGVAGIGAVLLWTFGFMGWVGIQFNQLFIAVPVLLIGLSIDYAIHVFMRQREHRPDRDVSARAAMATALGGLGLALTLVTAAAVIGFLGNLVSPVAPIRQFGIVCAIGISAALIIFGGLIPAVKLEIDDLLEGYGFDRTNAAFGTSGGPFSRALSIGQVAARRSPLAVVLVALVITAGGVAGATQVNTTFDQNDFIADDPSDLLKELPEPIAPGDYTVKQNLEFINANFVRQDSQTEILVEGDVGQDQTLQRVATARETATDQSAVVVLSDGTPDITGPLSVMRAVAAENESFSQTFTAADTDGDGVPNQNVTGVYDQLFEAAPSQAAEVINREDGAYEAVRLTVSVSGDAGTDETTSQSQAVAGEVDGSGLAATATGQPIVFGIVEDALFDTVVEALVVTLIATSLFLMVVYRLTQGSALLGLFTIAPIALSVSWILGSMAVLEIPFNVVTGTITSLTVGLGVAYNIHMTERYQLELSRDSGVWGALRRSVMGTGGALLGSAATTIGGFGVLAVAIVPMLQQFGLATALTIGYAFIGSVLLLPSLLVIWTRYVSSISVGSQVSGRSGGPDSPPATPGPTADTDGTSRRALASGASAGQEPGGTMQARSEDGEADTTPPARASTGVETAGRRFSPQYAESGQTVQVSLEVRVPGSAATITEQAFGTPTVDSVSPEPTDLRVVGDQLFYAWSSDDSTGSEPPTRATGPAANTEQAGETAAGAESSRPESEATTLQIEYTVTVPEEAGDGDLFDCEGTVHTGSNRAAIESDSSVTVVTDLFERIVAGGEVTSNLLTAAGEHAAAGRLSVDQLERVYDAWLRTHASEQPQLPEGDGGRDMLADSAQVSDEPESDSEARAGSDRESASQSRSPPESTSGSGTESDDDSDDENGGSFNFEQ